MKDMIYLMSMEWDWIKQRPQFLAENLAKYYRIKVIYRHGYNRKILSKNNKIIENLEFLPVYTIPLIHRYRLTSNFSELLRESLTKRKIKENKSEYIYLTNPLLVRNLLEKEDRKIIYDCMDYHVEIVNDKIKAEEIRKAEKKLLSKADIVLVSSDKLKKNLIRDYNLSLEEKKKLFIIRNGYNGDLINVEGKNIKNDRLVISYFGTISHWFDFEKILKSLDDFSNIEYKIIGPIDNVEVPIHDRISYVGSVKHEELYDYIRNDDILIMPFKINEIIEAVDPVKLYEYINYSKNIISVKYKEIERFENFVYFYNTYSEYKSSIEKLLVSRELKYSQEDRISFLSENTWASRAKEIYNIIEKMESEKIENI